MDKLSCPSAPHKKGNFLFGKFNQEDNLELLEEQVLINSSLLAEIKESPNPAKYRSTMTCATKGCGNWNGEKCIVPDQMNSLLKGKLHDSIESCSIRSSCRWFYQEGMNACKICPLVRTEYIDLEAYL